MDEPWFCTGLDKADELAAEQVAGLADNAARLLAVARALASQGREVELTGLDDRIGQLCARALDLPPRHGREMRARLVFLLAELDALALALRPD